jgi:hypothetical protein
MNLLNLFFCISLYFLQLYWVIPDYHSYKNFYEGLANQNLSYLDGDILYVIYNKIFIMLNISYELFRKINTLINIIIPLIISFYIKNKLEKLFFIMIFLYIYTNYGFAHTRFALASLIFLIINYYTLGKKHSYLTVSLTLSTLMHISYFLPLTILTIRNKLILLSLFFSLFIFIFFEKLVNILILYLDNNFDIPTAGFFPRLLLTFLFVFLSFKLNIIIELYKIRFTAILILFLSFCLYFFGYITFADRINSIGFVFITLLLLVSYKYQFLFYKIVLLIIITVNLLFWVIYRTSIYFNI